MGNKPSSPAGPNPGALPPVPPPPPPTNQPTISVKAAIYAANCGPRDLTAYFQRQFDGQISVNYAAHFNDIVGDPCQNTAKPFSITYACGSGANETKNYGPASGENYTISISCPAAPAGAPSAAPSPAAPTNRYTGVQLIGPPSLLAGQYFEVKALGDWTDARGAVWSLNGIPNAGCQNPGCGFYAPTTVPTATISYTVQGKTGTLTIPVSGTGPPRIRPNAPTDTYIDVFSPENVAYTCTDLQSYKNWINSIQILYPEVYASSKYNLDNSASWSDAKKNTFCNILERTTITKSLTPQALKTTSVL
uniref:Uncharacterized protein n=1 Tax=viral metagenome TaxID=1070528 RepID=A0A6C0L7Z7_9ZZZZ